MTLSFEHLGIAVSDIDRSVQFYRDILGLELMGPVREVGGWGSETATIVGLPGARMKVAKLRLDGDLYIELLQYLYPEGKKTVETRRCDVGSSHISFIVRDVQKAYDNFKAKGVCFVSLPAKNSMGLLATYFYDPDGITLAIIEKPAQK